MNINGGASTLLNSPVEFARIRVRLSVLPERFGYEVVLRPTAKDELIFDDEGSYLLGARLRQTMGVVHRPWAPRDSLAWRGDLVLQRRGISEEIHNGQAYPSVA